MSKELIVKLAKLANNNPNENEANMAARKVCKLLEALNFENGWNTSRRAAPPPSPNPTPNPARPPEQSGRSAMDEFEEFIRRQQEYYAEKARQAQQQKGRNPYDTNHQYNKSYENARSKPYVKFTTLGGTIFTRWKKRWRCDAIGSAYWSEFDDRMGSQEWHSRIDGWEPVPDPSWGRDDSKKRGDEKRHLQCKKCGQFKDTLFNGLQELFICMDCQADFRTRQAEEQKKQADVDKNRKKYKPFWWD